MENTDILVIGAGVIGLAVAERLSSAGNEVIVVEKHDGFGRETSSRNSEVIHGGMYYPVNTQKAELCVAGNRMLYDLCERKGIPFQKTGKIIVAASRDEVDEINRLYELGRANGAPGLRLVTKKEISAMEPLVACVTGLYSSETGSIDSHKLMEYFERTAQSNGAVIAYNCEVTGMAKNRGAIITEIRDADAKPMTVQSSFVINAAGLCSDKVAAFAGIDCAAAGYTIHLCKGEYFSVSNRHKGKVRHLVYPAPTSISLGIHIVLNLNGGMKLGPNAFYVDTVDYAVDASHQREFFDGARRYLPFIEYDDLSPDMAGIRPKLQHEGGGFRDFVIAEEGGRGVPGLVNLVGIESPGLTSCLAIAEKVARMVDGR